VIYGGRRSPGRCRLTPGLLLYFRGKQPVLKGWVALTRKMPCLGLGVRRLLWTRPNKHTQARARAQTQRDFHVRYVTTGIYGVSYREGCVYSHSSLPVHIRHILLVQGGVSLPVSFAPHALIWPSVLESLVS